MHNKESLVSSTQLFQQFHVQGTRIKAVAGTVPYCHFNIPSLKVTLSIQLIHFKGQLQRSVCKIPCQNLIEPKPIQSLHDENKQQGNNTITRESLDSVTVLFKHLVLSTCDKLLHQSQHNNMYKSASLCIVCYKMKVS